MERLESFVSRMIEGWSARLFGAKLQPVQIAKRLIRTMEAHQTISLSKTFVPNSYVVSLSATDFAQFEQYKRSLDTFSAYGPIAFAAVMLTWFYVTAVIILVGAEVIKLKKAQHGTA